MKDVKEWKDITIGQYLEMQDISNDHTLDDMQKMTKLVSIVYELDIEEIPMSQALALMDDIKNLMNLKIEPEKLQKTYKVGNYTCKPTSFDKMTMAQFMDFQEMANSGEEHLVDTIAVCLVPKGLKYNVGYDIDDFKEDILKLPIIIAPTLIDFFQQALKKSWKHSLRSLVGQTIISREMNWKQKKTVLKAIPVMNQALDFLTM